ncbi:hypothetical protein EVAR_9732_1 [Eumeta japonica]|uniref:Uncharacterized protein n=1 Tax=Eumeta variegata TaxID=151549 RepID=A0A4C1U5G9_EUMVA|nr:hypothetical protein EVAR_9732_1 [Eumeta japonica]
MDLDKQEPQRSCNIKDNKLIIKRQLHFDLDIHEDLEKAFDSLFSDWLGPAQTSPPAASLVLCRLPGNEMKWPTYARRCSVVHGTDAYASARTHAKACLCDATRLD